MDKFRVEFSNNGYNTGREVYAMSSYQAQQQILSEFPKAHGFNIINLSQEEKRQQEEEKRKKQEEERLKKQKQELEEERRNKEEQEKRQEQELRLEEEKINRMNPEEKKVYLRQKIINNVSWFIAVFALLGMWYGSSHNKNLMGICFIIAIIALTVCYWKLILGFFRFIFGLFILASLLFGGTYLYKIFLKNEAPTNKKIMQNDNNLSQSTNQKINNNIKKDSNTSTQAVPITKEKTEPKENISQYDKAFESQIQKIMTSYWDKTPDTVKGNKGKVRVKISNKGTFSYKIISLSYNNEFNDKFKQFLESMVRIEFPKYEKGSFFEIEIAFQDI